MRSRAGSTFCPLGWILATGLFVVLATATPAQDTSPAVDGTISDAPPAGALVDALPKARTAYRVGIAALAIRGDSSPDLRAAAVTFPQLLYESLSAITEHDLSDDERAAYARKRIAAAIMTAATQLASAVDARDRLLFSPATRADARVQQREQADAQVTSARELLASLRTVDPMAIPSDRMRPVEFLAGLDDGELLDAPTVTGDPRDADPAMLAALASITTTEDLDLLIWGTVEETVGYLAVDLYAYRASVHTSVPVGGTIALSQEVGLDAPVVARDVAPVLLGRSFASLTVNAGDPDAAIIVDGALLGYESAVAPFLRSGEHEVRVQAPGRLPQVQNVDLSAGQSRTIELSLAAGATHEVRIQTSPAGANVYADSLWIGTTPLDHAFPAGSTVVRVLRDGYLESRFVVNDQTAAVVNRALLPDSVDWSLEIKRERDAFYQAFTWFVVSIPVSMLLNGGYESVRAAFPPAGSSTLSQSELERLARTGNILYWSWIGGLLVNAGLFVNLVISIVDYVAVGEGSHNQ